MSELNNPPAFPTDNMNESHAGMRLRDYFAAKALAGMMAHDKAVSGAWTINEMAKDAYTQADAMLAARMEGAK
mgnify:CR=1 FL=1|tara:strand:+ start:10685 stop:10903 length:219 start_codon:yes stop_codon:yes gene_type:complete